MNEDTKRNLKSPDISQHEAQNAVEYDSLAQCTKTTSPRLDRMNAKRQVQNPEKDTNTPRIALKL